ncbi:unnamed protein product [Cunninghamella echinulata]
MSLEQKVSIMSGIGNHGPCVGTTQEVKGLFPSICYQDGPIGVRSTKGITAGVSGINTAASFDKKAIRERGQYIGKEFRGKGINVFLGPSMNMVRTPMAGRNFETFGEDPYLSAIVASETILGVQSNGVIAQAKHVIANEQETFRKTSSSNVGDRALREVYLWPFEKSINAGVGSMMCSYNKVNGTYACENKYILNEIIKGDLNFKGFITSDWLATHSTVESANNGLDVSQPNDHYFGANLVKAVNDGKVSKEKIRDMAMRIVATWYKFGQNDGYPSVNMHAFDSSKDQNINVQEDHKKYVRQLGAASIVLLKNQDKVLPLLKDKVKSIAVIGTDAGNSTILGNDLCGNFPCLTGHVSSGGGSASVTFPYLITPQQGIEERAGPDIKINRVNSDINIISAHIEAKNSDVAIVFSNIFTMEAFDRLSYNLDRNGDILIRTVANANKNTIVVIHSPSAVKMDWINHPNIKAVVWAGYLGQESGHALADILFGDVNPSGRLPYTIAKDLDDYPAKIHLLEQNVDYDEGIFVGYRHFDQNNIEPLFEFGHGLSYTNFTYSKLKVAKIGTINSNNNNNTSGSSSSSPIIIKADVNIKNSGDRDGNEIVQAYIGFPKDAKEPPKVLRGFEKVFIKKSESIVVHFELNQHELSIWDEGLHTWVVPRGEYHLYIGASSRDIRQSISFNL